MSKARKTVWVILMLTIIFALLYMVYGVMSIFEQGGQTSFPWYYACFAAVVYFGGPILIEIIIYIVLWAREKKKD